MVTFAGVGELFDDNILVRDLLVAAREGLPKNRSIVTCPSKHVEGMPIREVMFESSRDNTSLHGTRWQARWQSRYR